MSRVQLSINVSDFDAAVAFYSRLFGAAPAKLRPGTPTSPSMTRRSSWC
jgi:catechol 2,3-dioxygenase-like lactoylglutathione lyase family enzyme